MIQRVQSIFLLLGGLIMGLLLTNTFDISRLDGKSDMILQAAASTSFEDGRFTIDDHLVLVILTLLSVVLSLITIFLFKNRPLQITLTKTFLFITLLINGLSVFLMYKEFQTVQENTQVSLELSIGLFLPIVALLFGYLALRNISKDEKLVKSMDRLR